MIVVKIEKVYTRKVFFFLLYRYLIKRIFIFKHLRNKDEYSYMKCHIWCLPKKKKRVFSYYLIVLVKIFIVCNSQFVS